MFVSLAGPTSPAYSCCPGVLTQSSASGLNQTPSGVGSLTVSFPPRPTSPAYSSRVSVLTQFCALRRVSDSSFTPQANESRVFVRLGVLTQSAPRVLNRAPRIGSLTLRSPRRPTSPACGAQCNRSSPRFERGAPNFARALTFLPRNTCRFADFASGGLQRPQTTFQRGYWGARTSLTSSIPRSTHLREILGVHFVDASAPDAAARMDVATACVGALRNPSRPRRSPAYSPSSPAARGSVATSLYQLSLRNGTRGSALRFVERRRGHRSATAPPPLRHLTLRPLRSTRRRTILGVHFRDQAAPSEAAVAARKGVSL